MGLRFRLKATFDLSGYHGQARVVLDALKKYGMIVADNGSNWFITGAADSRWDDNDLNQLKTVPAARSKSSTPAKRYITSVGACPSSRPVRCPIP